MSNDHILKMKKIWDFYNKIPLNKRETHIKMGLVKENKKMNFLEKSIHWCILFSAFSIKEAETNEGKAINKKY